MESESRFPTKAVLTGVAGLALGVVVALSGTWIGRIGTTAADVAAGTVVVVGITVALLSVFLFLLPAVLPSK